MEIEFITKADFQSLKNEIVEEIKKLILTSPPEQKEWLKTSDVTEILSCSPGTIQNLRINGTLPFTKMGGTIYYAHSDVMQIMSKNKNKAA